MNYITGSFSPAVSKSTVKMPVDQSGAPLVVDEDQIKVSDIPRLSVESCDSSEVLNPLLLPDISFFLRDVQRHVSFLSISLLTNYNLWQTLL